MPVFFKQGANHSLVASSGWPFADMRRGYRLSETIGVFFDAVPEAGVLSIATGAVTVAVPSKRISATNAPGVE
jgi:hypothetical protein